MGRRVGVPYRRRPRGSPPAKPEELGNKSSEWRMIYEAKTEPRVVQRIVYGLKNRQMESINFEIFIEGSNQQNHHGSRLDLSGRYRQQPSNFSSLTPPAVNAAGLRSLTPFFASGQRTLLFSKATAQNDSWEIGKY